MNALNSSWTPRRYIRKYMKRVHGYTHYFDAEIFRTILEFQNAKNVFGSLVEIGVHHGRSFFILAFARKPGEKMLAIDLFEDDPLNFETKGAGRDQKFFEHCDKLEITLTKDEVYKGSSLNLDARSVLSKTGPVRFFSVDGGHMLEHVRNDLFLAEGVLIAEGVIAIDDFSNMYWPEVAFGSYEFLKASKGKTVPFLVTRHKLYCCGAEYANTYRELIKEAFASSGCIKERITILGSDTLLLSQRITDRIRDEILARLNLAGT